MKTSILCFLAAVLCLGSYTLWIPSRVPAKSSIETQRIRTAKVESQDIRFEVTVAGSVFPAEQVSVRPEVNGMIESLLVDIGDKVSKGTVLFTLDDKNLQSQRASSVTEIDRAQLQLDRADRKLRQNREMYMAEVISEDVFKDSQTEYDLAANAVERSRKALLIIEEKLSKTQIRAPFDCTVLLRPVSVGQAVSGSGGVGGGTEVLVIADLNRLVINAQVNQVDVVHLRVGQTVDVNVEAIASLVAKGRIERVSPQATNRNGIMGFSVRILLSEMDSRIQPGMTANVTIPVYSADGVNAVPLSAVFTEDQGHYVYVQTPDGSERRSVDVGVADYRHVEILSGLASGEEVWLENPPDMN